MSLTDKVKQLALEQQLDYVRIAPMDRFVNAPEGHKPTDLLHGAKSVISIGMNMSEGIRQANILAHETGLRHALYPYLWFGYGQINLHFLDRAAHLITRMLEKAGYVSLPIMASGVEDNTRLMGPISNRHAAVAAGVGEFGWHSLCVTNQNGPRQRFSSVITTAELEPDPLYEGPPICDIAKCKSYCQKKYGVALPVCVKVCPVGALSEEKGLSLTIGHRTFSYARVDKWRCLWASATLREEQGSLKPMPPPKVIDNAVLARARAELPAYSMEYMVIGRSHRCGKCITCCPIIEMNKPF